MDKLQIKAAKFYDGQRLLAQEFKKDKHLDLDEGGKQLVQKAYERKQIAEAKQHSYLRRVYSPDYIHRCDDGKTMTLDTFEQLGPRWVKSVEDFGIDHRGWYTDAFSGETINGVVLCFTRHGPGESHFEHAESEAKGREIYMAGTRHSDWDGVTLDLDITDDVGTAARWADKMAEQEAEICREEDEKFQAEEEAARKAEEAIEEEHAI